MLACPEPLSGAEPSKVAPSKKATDPLGVPPPGGVTLTVAVNVTAAPTIEGFGDEATDAVVGDWFTVCVVFPLDPP
jgi:hypothetical protein